MQFFVEKELYGNKLIKLFTMYRQVSQTYEFSSCDSACPMYMSYLAWRKRGQGAGVAQISQPYPNQGLCPPITTCSPRFVDLPTALINDYRNAGSSLNTIVTNLIGGHNLFSLDGIGLMYPPKQCRENLVPPVLLPKYICSFMVR